MPYAIRDGERERKIEEWCLVPSTLPLEKKKKKMCHCKIFIPRGFYDKIQYFNVLLM